VPEIDLDAMLAVWDKAMPEEQPSLPDRSFLDVIRQSNERHYVAIAAIVEQRDREWQHALTMRFSALLDEHTRMPGNGGIA